MVSLPIPLEGVVIEADGFIAKLAISIARKLGALIFLVPEDIVDVRPRLVSVHQNSSLQAFPKVFFAHEL